MKRMTSQRLQEGVVQLLVCEKTSYNAHVLLKTCLRFEQLASHWRRQTGGVFAIHQKRSGDYKFAY